MQQVGVPKRGLKPATTCLVRTKAMDAVNYLFVHNARSERLQLLISSGKQVVRKAPVLQHAVIDDGAVVEIEAEAGEVLHAQVAIQIDGSVFQPCGQVAAAAGVGCE